MAKRRAKYNALWWILSFALLARLAHFPGEFLYDDVTIIQENHLVQELKFAEIWKSPYWNMPERGIFRPLTVFTLALNQAILPNAAWFFHLTNLLIHLLNTYLLLILLHRWLPRRHLGHAIMTLLFALHPALTEAIHLVVGRAELLVASCALTALLLASLYLQDRCKAWVLYLAALTTAVGVLCKENAVVIPGLIWLLAVTIERSGGGVLRRPLWPAARGPLILLILLAVLMGYWRQQVLGKSLPERGLVEMQEPLQRLWVPLQVIGMMGQRIVWPQNLQWDYDRFTNPAASSPAHPYVLLGLAILLAWGAYGMLSRKRGRWLLPLWPLLAALTTLQLLPIGALFAERFLYLPILCLVIGIAFLMPEPKGYREERAVWPFAWFLLALCFGLSVKASWAWRDKLTFWTTVKQQAPFSINATFNLAALKMKSGEFAQARTLVEENLGRNPDSFYGHMLLRDILKGSAAPTAELVPVVKWLVERQPSNAANFHDLALLHLAQNDLWGAQQNWRQALQLDPQNKIYQNNLVGVLIDRQVWDEAQKLNQPLAAAFEPPALTNQLLITKATSTPQAVQRELSILAERSPGFSETQKLALFRTLFVGLGCVKGVALPEPAAILSSPINVVQQYQELCKRNR